MQRDTAYQILDYSANGLLPPELSRYSNATLSKVVTGFLEDISHGVINWCIGMSDASFITSALLPALSANNTFLTPTGPTYFRIVAFAKPTHSRMGRFSSTHLTECCLSIFMIAPYFDLH